MVMGGGRGWQVGTVSSDQPKGVARTQWELIPQSPEDIFPPQFNKDTKILNALRVPGLASAHPVPLHGLAAKAKPAHSLPGL